MQRFFELVLGVKFEPWDVLGILRRRKHGFRGETRMEL